MQQIRSRLDRIEGKVKGKKEFPEVFIVFADEDGNVCPEYQEKYEEAKRREAAGDDVNVIRYIKIKPGKFNS